MCTFEWMMIPTFSRLVGTFPYFRLRVPSMKLRFSHLKIDDWKTSPGLPFWGPTSFQGRFAAMLVFWGISVYLIELGNRET